MKNNPSLCASISPISKQKFGVGSKLPGIGQSNNNNSMHSTLSNFNTISSQRYKTPFGGGTTKNSKSKFPVEIEIMGKPSTLVNKQGVSQGRYMNKTLNDMKLKDLISMSENPHTRDLNIVDSFQKSSV